jgi:hypothetical protein
VPELIPIVAVGRARVGDGFGVTEETGVVEGWREGELVGCNVGLDVALISRGRDVDVDIGVGVGAHAMITVDTETIVTMNQVIFFLIFYLPIDCFGRADS